MKRTLQNPSLQVALVVFVLLGLLFVGFNWARKSPSSPLHGDAVGASSDAPANLFNPGGKVREDKPMPVYGNWKNFTVKDGLPDNKINAVRIDGDRVWAATAKGLAVLENGRWKVYTKEDGLAHNGVLFLDVSEETGDVWIGTLAGLNRLSAGQFQTYNQFNSGMPNDVIYQVACQGKYVWMATGGGAGCLNTHTGQWEIFTEHNAPMHEPWTYGVSATKHMVYIAAWGGGVIEFNSQTRQFRDYTDPDGEMELDLFVDDGLIHDITTSAHFDEGVLWVSTYFGMSEYDGKIWKGYYPENSGLASNFVNMVKARNGIAWACTDNGLSSFDGNTWVTYLPHSEGSGGEVIITHGAYVEKRKAGSSISNNFIWGVDMDDNTVWVATAKGLSRGEVVEKLHNLPLKM